MSLKLAARFVALEASKVADLQENDTTAHLLDLSSILPKKTMAVLIGAARAAGTGSFQVYPRSHATQTFSSTLNAPVLHPIKNRELKWKNSVANDDWDIWLLGYFVQKRTR